MAIRVYRCLALAGAGLAAGIAYGSLRLAVAGEYDPELPSMPDPDRLPQMLEVNPLQEPALRNVVVFPIQSESDRAQLVTCELRQVEYRPDGSKLVRWEPVKAWISIPVGPENHSSLESRIQELAVAGRIIPDVSVAWWRRPGALILACGALGALVLGSGSLVLDRVRAEDPTATAKPGPVNDESEQPAGPVEMTSEDRIQLAAAIDALDPGIEAPNATGRQQKAASPAPRIDRDRVPTHSGISDPPSEKHYEGEYYPVEKPASHP
jgi:hypothetical protein